MQLLRQTWTLAKKDLLLAGRRSWFGTLLSAVVFPVIVTFVLSYVRILTETKGTGGVQTPSQVLSLREAFDLSSKANFIIIDHNLDGPDLRAVIYNLSSTAHDCGKIVHIVSEPDVLSTICPGSVQGITNCFAAVEFWSSPDEGLDAIWNYTLHYDDTSGSKFKFNQRLSDVQLYVLPIQHAVDDLITSTHGGSGLPDNVQQFEFASETENQFLVENVLHWDALVEQFLAFVFFVAMCGSIYHIAFHITSQREKGLLDLIDAMMPAASVWHCAAARIFATHLSFDLLYLPGWIAMGVLTGRLAFPEVGAGWYIALYVLTGLATSSYSILFSSFFKKDQTCALSALILAIVLALAAQFSRLPAGFYESASSIWSLSLLFPPCTFVYFILLSTWPERADIAPELGYAKLPTSLHSDFKASSVTGALLLPLLAFQIILYPIIAGVIESFLHGHATRTRRCRSETDMGDAAVRLTAVSKHYSTGLWKRAKVDAVKGLDLSLHSGSITVLCGVNASGKTTTLNAIAGLESISSGQIEINRANGVGLCPQPNVHWAAMTVEENIRFFEELKRPLLKQKVVTEAVAATIAQCDLGLKRSAQAQTLSGGQMRKLQLAMMLAGASKVCCIDEASAGIDPLARRKVWEILLRERGRRTMLLTTHFLDESEILSDHIAILSKGQLKAEGSVASLKRQYGGDYHVILPHPERLGGFPDLPQGTTFEVRDKTVVFKVPASPKVAALVGWLDRFGVSDYRIRSPTMEDVFLTLAEEMKVDEARTYSSVIPDAAELEFRDLSVGDGEQSIGSAMALNNGEGSGAVKQLQLLLVKRLIILNYMLYFWALFLPLAIVGLVNRSLGRDTVPVEAYCKSSYGTFANSPYTLFLGEISQFGVFGPLDRVSKASLKQYIRNEKGLYDDYDVYNVYKPLWEETRFVNSSDDFYHNFDAKAGPINLQGGIWLGETPVFAYATWSNLIFAPFYQAALDMVATNMTWSLNLKTFDKWWRGGDNAQSFICIATVLGFAIFPGFFALYPTSERTRNVRAMQYSNGVLSSSLWAAHFLFDLIFILLICVFAAMIIVFRHEGWYAPGYVFVVMLLYSIAATLYGYLVSLWAKSQVMTLACTSLAQAVVCVLFFVGYVVSDSSAPASQLYSWLEYIYFTMSLICPGVSLFRALLVSGNMYGLACNGPTPESWPGKITLFGGPILYLMIQIVVFAAVLVWCELGWNFDGFGFRKASDDDCGIIEEIEIEEGEDIIDDEKHLTLTENGLRLFNLTKTFGPVRAVEKVNLGVLPSERFALCGPNGAGKSTLISLIRGQLQPDYTDPSGAVWISGEKLMQLPKVAKNHLGVCPQFDAVDAMTLKEHLQFYARIRGVPNREANIQALVTTLGLEEHVNKLPKKMSGGTRRKLSLAIALIANPSVLLLDEPTTGMDPAAKRALWATLTSISAGRSLLITTHSMEEAAALCDRAGIIGTRMLALGPIADLCAHYGDKVYVQIVHENAPYTSADDMNRLWQWAQSTFLIVETERRDFGGQLHFAVPIRPGPRSKVGPADGNDMGRLFCLIEENKNIVGIRDYSIRPTTLDQVFLNVVSKHDVTEELMEQEKGKWWHDLSHRVGVPKFLRRRGSDLSGWTISSDDV